MCLLFFINLAASRISNGQLHQIRNLIAFGQFWPAYENLNNIIRNEKSVSNDLYRLRAQCCLNMVMPKECIKDAENIIKNKPSAEEKKVAYSFHARSLMLLGKFTEAEDIAKKSGDRGLMNNCKQLMKYQQEYMNLEKNGNIAEACQYLDVLIQNAPKAEKLILSRADLAWKGMDYNKYREMIDKIKDDVKNDTNVLYRYAIVSLCDGKISESLENIKSCQKLKGKNNCGAVLNAVNLVNQNYHAAEKFIEKKNAQEAEKAINITYNASEPYCKADSVLMNSISMLRLKLLKLQFSPKELLDMLNELLEKNPNDLDLLLERGDVHLELKDYDAALFDYSNVQRQRLGDRRAQEGINKAQELKKQSTYIDYYKILEIEKGSSAQEIKAAYRKMVIKWHPDRHKTNKKEAESKMKMINKAYDILSDPEKKEMYDQGRDPEDPMSGQQGFNPFDLFNNFGFNFGGGDGGYQEFHFGGGGGQGFHFEFHF